MKGILLAAAVVIAAALFAAPAAHGAVVTVGIGVQGSCEWWKPPWSDGARFLPPSSDFPVSLRGRVGGVHLPPAGMYGFIISVRFLESWYFSSSFRYGSYFSRSATPDWVAAGSLPVISVKRDINKYDFEADGGYWFVRYAAVFICVRTRSYDFVEKMKYAGVAPAPWLTWGSANAEFIEAGPGLGMRLSVPVFENLSVTARITALVLPGGASFTYDFQYRTNGGSMELVLSRFSREGYHSVAGAFALALAYYIAPAGVTLETGGRYEVSRYTHHRIMKGFLDYGGKYDRGYGVFISAVYSVTLGGDAAQ